MEYLLLIYHSEANLGRWRRRTRRIFTVKYGQLREELAVRASSWEAAMLMPIQWPRQCACEMATGGYRWAICGNKEQLGGYFLVNADDLDEAIAIAARIPSARTER